MKNNILITIQDKTIIPKLKKLGITDFVFPLENFSVGIPNTFLVSEIDEKGYIYINRILNNEGIDELKSIKNEILNNKNIRGIIFDDLGVLEIFKNTSLEKILYMTHFLCSSVEVNEYLEIVDTVILSTDITLEEIKYIINKSIKEVSLFTFGLISTMYSRRLLIGNYVKFHKLDKVNPFIIKNQDNEFIMYENNYGTVLYNSNYFDGRVLNNEKVKYNFYHPIFLNNEEVINILNNQINVKCDNGFLYKETIYKLKDGD